MYAYLAPFLAFGAALLGVLGNTHDPKKKGLRRITRVGWVTTFLAIASLAFGIWQLSRQDVEQRILAKQRAQLREIGTTELCAASLQLKASFDILHAAATGATMQDGRDLGFPFALLSSESAHLALSKLDLLKNPPARPGARDTRPLWLVAPHHAAEFSNRANLTLAKYDEHLDTDLVLQASLLINDNFVQWLVEMPSNVEHLSKIPDAELPAVQPSQAPDHDEALKKLEILMRRTGGDGEQLICKPIATVPAIS